MVAADAHSWRRLGGVGVYEHCPERLFLAWELAVGKTGRVQIWLPAHGLMG